MKKIICFFMAIIALLGMNQAVAQEYEYVPFVREGVKWIYSYDNPFFDEILNMPFGEQYYSFEMGEDVLIEDKYYKPIILTHYVNGNTKEVEDFIPVYLREENKVVYAIHPDGVWYPQCPVGIGNYVNDPGGYPLIATNEEFILYDFNDPVALYDSIFEYAPVPGYVTYTNTTMVTIGNRQSKCHNYRFVGDSDAGQIIESIGYDGYAGMPLFYFEVFTTGFQVGYGLSHVIEDGGIIYKGINYDPNIRVGIDEVVEDQTVCLQDPRYYDLMGHAVGTEVPTTPGIYIHQGKKICVSQMP